jgi:flavorubredoxin
MAQAGIHLVERAKHSLVQSICKMSYALLLTMSHRMHTGNEIKKETATIHSIIITHLNPDISATLAEVTQVINRPKDKPLNLIMSNPAQQVITSLVKAGRCEVLGNPEIVTFTVPSKEEEIRIGRRKLQCIAATTPRYPELLCLYERSTRRLFSSCFFSAHVSPQKGSAGTDGTDIGGWAVYGSDWTYFFDCMFAPVVVQASQALGKLNLSVATASSGSPLLILRQLFGGSSPDKNKRPVASILPRHGPVIRRGVVQLVNEYGR